MNLPPRLFPAALALLLSAGTAALAQVGRNDPAFHRLSWGNRDGAFSGLLSQPDGKVISSRRYYGSSSGSSAGAGLVVRTNSTTYGSVTTAVSGGNSTITNSGSDSFFSDSSSAGSSTITNTGGSALNEFSTPTAGSATINNSGSGSASSVVSFFSTDATAGSATINNSGSTPSAPHQMRAAKNVSTQGEHTRIVRQLADGRMDLSFHAPIAQWRAYSMALQADGKVLVGGAYYGMNLNGKTLGPLARLNSDGSIDSDFNPAIAGYVTSLDVVAGGKILAGGLFRLPNRNGEWFLVRFNADGSEDRAFQPVKRVFDEDQMANTLAVQPDGKILFANPRFDDDADDYFSTIVRLNTDGRLDPAFHRQFKGFPSAMVVQTDGKVVFAGYSYDSGGDPHGFLVRLENDGRLDPAFHSDLRGFISKIMLQEDGRIIVSGDVYMVDDVAVGNVRLNADGSIDRGTDFQDTASMVNNLFYAEPCIALQGDGRMLTSARRLLNDPAPQTLSTPDMTRIVWRRGGSAPQISQTGFELSTDEGAHWTWLGRGQWRDGAWMLGGVSLPPVGNFARADVPSGASSNRPRGGPGESIIPRN